MDTFSGCCSGCCCSFRGCCFSCCWYNLFASELRLPGPPPMKHKVISIQITLKSIKWTRDLLMFCLFVFIWTSTFGVWYIVGLCMSVLLLLFFKFFCCCFPLKINDLVHIISLKYFFGNPEFWSSVKSQCSLIFNLLNQSIRFP